MDPITNGMRPIHPGEVLREEFLIPLGITAHASSRELIEACDMILLAVKPNVVEKVLKAEKAAKLHDDSAKRVYLVAFKGDPMASGHAAFARKITAALMAARAGKDEIVVTLHSPGGLVSAYGLMAAQMQRVRRV